MVVLMSKIDEAMPHEDWRMAQGIIEGLTALMKRTETSEVAEFLELCGVLSHSEALHFSGVNPKQQVLEEATDLLLPSSMPPVLTHLRSGFLSFLYNAAPPWLQAERSPLTS